MAEPAALRDHEPSVARILNVRRLLDGLPVATKPFLPSVDVSLASDDGMYSGDDAHYFACGASALNVVLSALQLADLAAPRAVLDFGAGAGRVTRWLRAAFPDADIDACDLRAQDMEFCRRQFRARTWVSGTDVAALEAPGTYDLIWVGSVLTHLSAERSGRLIDKLLSWTNPGGLLVTSTIGRAALSRRDRGDADYIDAEGWRAIKEQYAMLGFGYADYADQAGYGLSLTKLSWAGGLIENLRGARLVVLAEAVWDGLHDILAIQKMPASEFNDAHEPTAEHVARGLLARQRDAAALEARVAALESSTSWRMTAPLRAAARIWR